MTKRILAMLLAAAMVVGLLPMNVIAGTAEDRTKYTALEAHDNAKHICEHCIAEGKSEAEATVTWTPWGEGKTTLPNTAGHYYLTANLNVTAATISSGHVVLCLNGKTVTANGTANDKADRFYNITKSGSLTIVDCTASGKGDTYKAGKFTGATNIAFNTSNASSDKSTGTVTVYDGIFEKNISKVTGNVFMVTGDSRLYIYGGRYAENEATGKGAGVIYGNAGANFIHIEDAVFYKNVAGYGGAVYHAGNKTSAVPTTVEVVNCTFDGNETTGSTGAALCFGNNAGVAVEGCTFTNNKANTAGGAIRITGTSSVLSVKDSVFTANEGKAGAGAIWAGGSVTLDSVTIKNNITKGTGVAGGLGAVTLDAEKTAQTLTVKGDTQIVDNTDGADAQRNVYMANGSDKIAVDSLAATARISVAGPKDAAVTDVLTNADNVKDNFLADDAALQVNVDNGKLVLGDKNANPNPPAPPVSGHTHCVCGDLTCTKTGDGHQQVTFEPWGEGKTTLPSAAGYYYLTKGLEVTTAEVSSGHVVLCLHGQTVTANGTSGNANDRFYTLKNAGSVTITDCTAAGEGDAYTAGTMTGGTASAFMFNNNDSSTGTLTIYDGIFTNNQRSSAGGVICVQGKGKLNIYGGLFSDNRCTNSTGGVIYLSKADNITHIENAVFKGNASASSGGVLYNNKAAVTLKNVTMTGNTGVGAGVIVSLGAVTYEDVTITGNTTTPGSSNYGALHHYNSSSTATVTLKGKTVIDNNLYGDAADGVERNLWLRNHSYKVSVNGLTEGAMIGLSCDSAKVSATNGNQYITSALGEFDPLPYFTSDNGNYILKVVDAGGTTGKRMVFADKPVEPDHPHKPCNDAACAEHADIDYRNWTEANTLPTSGNINLQTDVTLSAAVAVEGTLNICLNGHSITVNKKDTRAFALDNGDVLSITDCQGTGKITGGSRTYGGAISVHRGSTLNLFAGKITGNTALTEEGGALYVAGGNDQYPKGAVVNMYGGEISNNSARVGAAVRMTNPSGAGTPAQFNMYGGKITGNTNTGTNSNNYAAVNGDKAIINLLGGEISGNQSATYGAVHTTANTQLTLGGDIKILNNTVNGKVANLYLAGKAKFAVDGLTAQAKVAVTAETYDRFISGETDTDYTGNFISDSAYRTITYKDKALYLGNSTEHQHCVCAGGAVSGCDHAGAVWTAWESNNSLPLKNGNYYLTEDVVLKDVQWIKNLKINLCLNGHTVTAAKNKRVLSTQETTVLSITDCAGGGKLTGGNSNFGGAIGVQAGSTLNLFGGTITGNKSVDKSNGQGGAIYLQAANSGRPGGTLNMYGGAIVGNEAQNGGAVYARNKSKINIFGGTIADNKSAAYGGAIYACEGIATDIENAVFEGNTAVSGGGAVYVTGANSVLNINNTSFKDNTIDGYAGGAIRAQSTGTRITITGSAFTGSKAQAGAGI